MNQQRGDRPFQFSLLALFIVITAACFFLAAPATMVLLVTFMFGLAWFMLGIVCVRDMLGNRISGRMSGMIFGSLFLIIGLVTCIGSFGLLVGSLFSSR